MSENKQNTTLPPLSKKEIARAGKTKEQLNTVKNNGYKMKNMTISPAFANAMALVWGIVFSLPMFIGYILYNGGLFESRETPLWEYAIIAITYFAFIIAHEGIHGICMYLFNGHSKDTIDFGLNSGMPYCTCQTPITKWKYIVVLVMPTFVLGTAFSIFTILTSSVEWLLFTFLLIGGGGGDFTICAKLLPAKEKDLMIVDHPYRCGFIALSKTYDVDDTEAIFKEFDDAVKANASDSPEEKQKNKKKFITGFVVGVVITLVAGIVGYLFGSILFS